MEVRCPVCQTSFKVGENGTPINPKEMNGIGYLVPETVRTECCKENKKMTFEKVKEVINLKKINNIRKLLILMGGAYVFILVMFFILKNSLDLVNIKTSLLTKENMGEQQY